MLLATLGLIANACSPVGLQGELPAFTSPPEQIQATLTESPLPPSATVTHTIAPPATTAPTFTPTQAPRIQVRENTNCRSGPGSDYQFEGVLSVGEFAEVLGKSSEPDYWLVTNEQLPGAGCWLWGEFAEVEGDVETLPVFTPAPSPTPQVGFDVYIKNFIDCGYTRNVVFAIHNVGGERIWSGYVEVQELGTREILYTARERHPFAGNVTPACPPDHGNELWPGETRYIHVPISTDVANITAVGIITLCTADHQGGTCLTEYIYFDLP
jgi:hypothetical protein